MDFEYIICHYGELALKGKNRRFFETKLKENIKTMLLADYLWVHLFPGRIVVKIKKEKQKDVLLLQKKLERIFGISYFCFAAATKSNIEDIKKAALAIINLKKGKTFRIETKRSDKNFPLNSQKINETVGEYVLKNQKKKVNLENPQVVCFIEILSNISFLYLKKNKGEGGMPSQTSGKVLSLMSGGIDSPVASYFLMRRGAKVDFVHFHAYPFTNKQSLEKTKKIAEAFSCFQGKSKICFVPFSDIQKEIFLKAPQRLRIILYRRAMFKISEIIAKKEKALALVTGENLGQVASQTLENIKAISQITKMPVFRPLIGMDKNEIVNLAKKIGTYDLSILPHQDCCSRFLPKHPETKADLKEVNLAEKKLNLKKLIKNAIFETKYEPINQYTPPEKCVN